MEYIYPIQPTQAPPSLPTIRIWQRGLVSFQPVSLEKDIPTIRIWQRGLVSFQPVSLEKDIPTIRIWQRGLVSFQPTENKFSKICEAGVCQAPPIVFGIDVPPINFSKIVSWPIFVPKGDRLPLNFSKKIDVYKGIIIGLPVDIKFTKNVIYQYSIGLVPAEITFSYLIERPDQPEPEIPELPYLKTLLPSNATKLELDLETSMFKRIYDFDVDKIMNTWNPDHCPTTFLSWLAWGFSTDTWGLDWLEDKKRRLISESIEIHKHKGTKYAIRKLFQTIGITDFEIVEWWEQQPPGEPYTFYVQINVSGDYDPEVMSVEQYKKVENILDTVKPARSHYNYAVRLKFGNAEKSKNALEIFGNIEVTNISQVKAQMKILNSLLTNQTTVFANISHYKVIRVDAQL